MYQQVDHILSSYPILYYWNPFDVNQHSLLSVATDFISIDWCPKVQNQLEPFFPFCIAIYLFVSMKLIHAI